MVRGSVTAYVVLVSGSDFGQKEGVFTSSTTPTVRLQNMLTHNGRGRIMDEKDVYCTAGNS